MYEESINQEDWAEQGEATVVGSGPELLFKGAECIVAQHDLIEKQRMYIKSLERRKDVYDD